MPGLAITERDGLYGAQLQRTAHGRRGSNSQLATAKAE
jgi:hypothetical protein